MDERIIDVDLTLLIETSYKARLKTRVLGWKEQSYIITDAVYSGGQLTKVTNNEPCKVRFLKNDFAYGFESQVITVLPEPFPLMFIKYPAKLESVKIQIAKRFQTNLPARLLDGSGKAIADAIVFDLSEGGCAVRTQGHAAQDLPPEAKYSLAFKLADQAILVESRIRTVERETDSCAIGLQFLNISDDNAQKLKSFLDQLSKQSG